MTQRPISAHGPFRWVVPHAKGHLLLFDRTFPREIDSSGGLRLLAIFVLLEGVIGPRLWWWTMAGLPRPPAWARVTGLLVLALILIRFMAGVKLPDLGLRPWRQWSTTEKSYFVQVVILVNFLFALLFFNRLREALSQPWPAIVVAVTYLLWGFYQELIYRGILQTELVWRWGAFAGIVVSNLLYTFGPLHFYHFASPSGRIGMFAAIFAIGLFFGVLFRRSGNLWMVGIFHGIGDVYMTGLDRLAN